MSERPSEPSAGAPVVSHRAIYHMRQEILRLLDRAGPGSSGVAELARDWQKSYRTMRPIAACALVARMAEDGREDAVLFAIAVLEGLSRRIRASDWLPVAALGECLSPSAAEALGENVALPLLERDAEARSRLAERVAAGDASAFERTISERLADRAADG